MWTLPTPPLPPDSSMLYIWMGGGGRWPNEGPLPLAAWAVVEAAGVAGNAVSVAVAVGRRRWLGSDGLLFPVKVDA